MRASRLTNFTHEQARHVLLMLNPVGQSREFAVPDLVRTIKWRRFIDTSAEPPSRHFPRPRRPRTAAARADSAGRTVASVLRGGLILDGPTI